MFLFLKNVKYGLYLFFSSKSTFHYDSNFWTNTEPFNIEAGETGLDNQETKLPTYWSTSFSKICLAMKYEDHFGAFVINVQANSLYSLIAEGQYRSTSVGRDTWKSLIGPQASLQRNCDKEGFNAKCRWRGARLGILANNENNCHTCDSLLGFGLQHSSTCGNIATHGGDNGSKENQAMGYIFVH